MPSSLKGMLVVFTAALLAPTPCQPLHAAESKTSQPSLNGGYSLFYDFCSQESQVSLLLWIKTTPPDIAAYAKDIAATAKEDMAILKKMSADDPDLKLDKISLPPFELSVRKEMADDRKQQLVWDSSGAAFAQAVRMTQSEVTNYGFHVAKMLAETEPDRIAPARWRRSTKSGRRSMKRRTSWGNNLRDHDTCDFPLSVILSEGERCAFLTVKVPPSRSRRTLFILPTATAADLFHARKSQPGGFLPPYRKCRVSSL